MKHDFKDKRDLNTLEPCQVNLVLIHNFVHTGQGRCTHTHTHLIICGPLPMSTISEIVCKLFSKTPKCIWACEKMHKVIIFFPKISLQEPLKTIKQQKGQGNVKILSIMVWTFQGFKIFNYLKRNLNIKMIIFLNYSFGTI
jgi:hypothetical protein